MTEGKSTPTDDGTDLPDSELCRAVRAAIEGHDTPLWALNLETPGSPGSGGEDAIEWALNNRGIIRAVASGDGPHASMADELDHRLDAIESRREEQEG